MKSVMNKTQFALKRHREKIKAEKKQIQLNNRYFKKDWKKQWDGKRIEEEIRQHEANRKREFKNKRKQKEIKQNKTNEKGDVTRDCEEENRELKQFERIQNRESLVEEDNISCRFLEQAAINKFYVNSLNLHRTKIETLEEFTGDFETIGSMLIGQIEQKANITFKIFEDFEAYIKALDVDYDSKDVIFTGWLYKLKTPDFN